MPQPSPALPFPLRDVGHGPYRVLRGGRKDAVEGLQAGLLDPETAQQQRLDAVLGHMAGTTFAKDHELDRVRTLSDLQAAVPVRSHSELLVWLDRVEGGEPGVLTRDPVRMLLETSGTTGRPKHLPVTDAWAATVARGQALWMLGLVREHEAVTRGKALTLVSSAGHAVSPGGLPIGSNTGRMQANQPWYVRLRYAAPRSLLELDSELKLYATLRFALQSRITSITTANPSTLLLMCRRLLEWREPLSQDLRRGTLRNGPAARLQRGRRRRLELRLRRRTPPPGPWTPARLWPLAAVSCWTGGPAAYFAARLQDALGGPVPIHPIGVTASEGTFSVTLDGSWPGSALFVTGHVLEVVDDSGLARPAWQAEVGEQVRLVVTTEAGLCRYDMGDIIEVVGRCGRTPVVRFVGKAGRYLNTVGERVSEAQLSAAALSAATATSLHPVGFTARAVLGEVPRYELAVEGLSLSAADRFVTAFDGALQEQNVEYAGKRGSDRLGAPLPVLLPVGIYAAWRAARVAAGAPDGQVKDPVMAVDAAEWAAIELAGQAAARDAAGGRA